jgi:transcriptional regulator with XRE-family HTH domain
VLIRDARINAGRSLEDCAATLNVPVEMFEAWEYGDEIPSLPQLEIIAYLLGVHVSHFWAHNTLEATKSTALNAQDAYVGLRQRMIGALLRQAREELQMTQEQLADVSHLPLESIEAYELGEHPIPMHELMVMCSALKRNLNYFLETSSQIGELLALKEQWRHFIELPEDLRRFAANPLNIGFIEVAMMLAQMPTDRLRRVGESVLNITM